MAAAKAGAWMIPRPGPRDLAPASGRAMPPPMSLSGIHVAFVAYRRMASSEPIFRHSPDRGIIFAQMTKIQSSNVRDAKF